MQSATKKMPIGLKILVGMTAAAAFVSVLYLLAGSLAAERGMSYRMWARGETEDFYRCTLVYDRLSKNGACELFVLYKQHYRETDTGTVQPFPVKKQDSISTMSVSSSAMRILYIRLPPVLIIVEKYQLFINTLHFFCYRRYHLSACLYYCRILSISAPFAESKTGNCGFILL